MHDIIASKAQVSIPWEAAAPPFRHGADDDNLARSFEESLRISKEIDEQLLESKKAMEKKKKSVQILLLGQSESGKSSVLRNFHLAFAPKHFESERLAWKIIIQLNLIGSIKLILDVLQHEWDTSGDAEPKSPLNRDLRRIRLGLSPLLFIEQTLAQLISPGTHNHRDVCVRPGSNWKAIFKARAEVNFEDTSENGKRRRSQNHLGKDTDATSVLAASKDDILVLWNDPDVRAVLKRRGVRMEETPGFFLNDIDRIADPNYVPSDADIMRARVRTLGVEEHYFVIEKGLDVGSEVYITDVGGSRSQRPRWIPYFEDVQTIVFLAPLTFNQALEEDPDVNRLEDSLMLWREICRNKLLAGATLILFFNKKDVLASTLAAGVKVKKYVPSYGELPNEVASVTKYFCDKFRTYHRKLSPLPRPFMFHETSAIDTNSMGALLLGIRETILRAYLQQGEMI
ncbi:putative G protein alpha subunit [Lyophyllum shimeji]|uniref:G protein alpha subunit n=1 Tax=Lyophyllum shimeji TaxID=47721 RepID=A0A9P3URE3_LYOSH|nr:putative G protein alpha subunit [Lyophyllum shimeji]